MKKQVRRELARTCFKVKPRHSSSRAQRPAARTSGNALFCARRSRFGDLLGPELHSTHIEVYCGDLSGLAFDEVYFNIHDLEEILRLRFRKELYYRLARRLPHQ